MEPFDTVTGPAAPLLRANVDTDQIIRVERLTANYRDEGRGGGLGAYALESLRKLPDGRDNPDFVLNRPEYRGTPILLAGVNFGCGSSREGAVWALKDAGIRSVIAPSFGDIFFANCFQNGVLPVVLAEAAVRRIAEASEAAPGKALTTVDLERQLVTTPSGETLPFAVDARRRAALLAGLDDIALSLRHADAVAEWQARDRAARPWAWEPLT
jgi:3-isopropylmalate/(R)-2-methylmalate dehydratase small subunit